MSYIKTRQQLEQEEANRLAPYASKNINSKGRDYPESKDEFRLDFQRDRDRILHSKAFRRLKGKTQVFVSHFGDHFRSRLTHSLEVAQISRSLARGLNVNEDLAECIALAHDLGHTPFGHAGEEAMNELLHRHGMEFEHNAQSRRIVEILEKKSSLHDGLNLTYEVREGLWKHRTIYDRQNHNLTEQAFLEAQIVDLADEIAFQNHDIDDGLRSKLIDINEMNKLELWKMAKSRADHNKNEQYEINQTISNLIKIMIEDVIQKTAKELKSLSPTSADDIRNAHTKCVSFSDEIAEHNHHLRHFLMNRFYKNPLVKGQCDQGKSTIKKLFFHYYSNPETLPKHYQNPDQDIIINIKDFIAGMTDNFALNTLNQIENEI
jgi:dGTPase